MKITALSENISARKDIGREHGLSLYIETDMHRILFDTGQSSLFAENAQKLGIDLREVDTAFLSHGHYDHGGGLKEFMDINEKAPVYISRYAFGDYYFGSERYIGLDRSMSDDARYKDRFIIADDVRKIDAQLALYSCNDRERPYPMETHGLTEKTGEGFVPERFIHEQYLMIKENGRNVLISGCSHKGILNIESWFMPDVLVGGFHFKDLDPDEEKGKRELTDAAKILMKSDTIYYTCHCTGKKQYDLMKNIMGDRLSYLSCGESIVI